MLLQIHECSNGYIIEHTYQNPGEQEWQVGRTVITRNPEVKVEVGIALEVQRQLEDYEQKLLAHKATKG